MSVPEWDPPDRLGVYARIQNRGLLRRSTEVGRDGFGVISQLSGFPHSNPATGLSAFQFPETGNGCEISEVQETGLAWVDELLAGYHSNILLTTGIAEGHRMTFRIRRGSERS